jgi:SNF2 family DNA or RNA helicase
LIQDEYNTSIIENSSEDDDDDDYEIEENIDDNSSELSPIQAKRHDKINEELSENSFDFSDSDGDNAVEVNDVDVRNNRKILHKKNGTKRKRKTDDKEVRPTLVNNGEKGLMKEDKVTLDDDWEDYDYLNRLENEGITRENEADIFVETGYGTTAFNAAWSQMHEYQKEGCRWMHGLYHDGVGGILGDEMGLGKTMQLCLHFGALGRIHRSSRTNDNECASFLIVCPATVLQHWVREMNKWEPTMRIAVLHNVSKTGNQLQRLDDRAREMVIRHLKKSNKSRALTILTTYEGLRKHKECVLSIEWTGVCLDEGQKIRNPQAEVTRIAK